MRSYHLLNFQNPFPPALNEQVQEEQPNKEAEDKDIPYSTPTVPSVSLWERNVRQDKQCQTGMTKKTAPTNHQH